MVNINSLDTEKINPNSKNIDNLSTLEIITLINEEDRNTVKAVEKALPDIENLVDNIYPKVKSGGRIIYIGAGTSGRLGVLDASECPPTYGVSPDLVIGLIAGGEKALKSAIEGAEDDDLLGREDLKNINLTENDSVIGIAASGRTPYVIGALEYANEIGALTGSISNVLNAEISKISNFPVESVPGPEVVTGSTRMKAGTTQKMILNMISTTIMIKIGKIYGNLMVDVMPSNEKLVTRAINTISLATDYSPEESEKLFIESGGKVKLAILMGITGKDKETSLCILEEEDGYLRNSINRLKQK